MSLIERLKRGVVARDARRPSFSPIDLIVRNRMRLKVRAKVAYAIDRQAIALGEKPKDIRNLKRQNITDLGFCISVVNMGSTRLAVSEVGLIGWFDAPRISLFEPMLHDNKPWPRVLMPGEEVIAPFRHSAEGPHRPAPDASGLREDSSRRDVFRRRSGVRFYA